MSRSARWTDPTSDLGHNAVTAPTPGTVSDRWLRTEIEVLTATARVRPEPENSLSWSFVRSHRLEMLMLLFLVVVLAIAEAIVIAYVVTSLFEPINNALSPIT